MPDAGTLLYFFAIVGGTLILGVAIAFGYLRNRKRTQSERLASERGAHDIYQREDRAPGP